MPPKGFQSVSLTPKVAAELDELRRDLAVRGTSCLPRALKPNGALTVSEIVRLGVRAVRRAMK